MDNTISDYDKSIMRLVSINTAGLHSTNNDSATFRKHLRALEAAGLVSSTLEDFGTGRTYTLTDAGRLALNPGAAVVAGLRAHDSERAKLYQDIIMKANEESK